MPTAAATALSRAVKFSQTFWGWVTTGISTFRERNLESNPETAEGRAYGSFEARRARYDLFWRLYSNTVYSRGNRWGSTYKDLYDLHGFIRNIYSPAYRLGEFWADHIWGGPLDPEAGDGKETPTALPIVTKNEAIRPAIKQIWADSNWQEYKEVACRYGAVLGDVAIAVVDDPAREKVYLRVVHPGTIARIDRDVFGNVKGYVIIEDRLDPEWDGTGVQGEVQYREVCERDPENPENIVYRTYKGDDLYDWRDYPTGATEIGPEWVEPYGFVPMVFVPHRDKGAGWGWSELFPGLSKGREVDDLASKLNDQIDKVIKAPRMITGAKATSIKWAVDDADDEDGGGRNQIPYLTSENENAAVHDLVGDLDIMAVSQHIASIVAEIERDCPELRADEAGADASGVSRRIARERIEARVIQRRTPYDARLVQVQQMALSIGAWRARETGGDGYAVFAGLPVDGYAKKLFDHAIGPRPVFTLTAAERLEEATARGTAIKGFTDAGLPLRRALIEVGYTESQADEILSEKEADDAAQMEKQRQMQAMGFDGELDAAPDANVDAQNQPGMSGNGGSRSGVSGKQGTPGGVMR